MNTWQKGICLHTFTLFWFRKTSVIIKIHQISFHVVVCDFPPEISSFFIKSFPFFFHFFIFIFHFLFTIISVISNRVVCVIVIFIKSLKALTIYIYHFLFTITCDSRAESCIQLERCFTLISCQYDGLTVHVPSHRPSAPNKIILSFHINWLFIPVI